MAEECACMEMGVAVGDCTPTPVDTDIWTQVVVHGPGQQKGPMSVTNRSVIYRLRPAEGEPFLVIFNGVWVDEAADQPFESLRELEEQTGAKVRYILAPAASHHLSLIHYGRAFPEASVCVAAGRIRRENPELMSLPNLLEYPPDQPPAELEEAGLRVRVVAGLMEGWRARRIARMSFNFGYQCDTTEPLVVFHAATGSLANGGHQWMYVPADEEAVFEGPGLMMFMLKLLIGADLRFAAPGKLTLEPGPGFAIHDKAALQASCREILSWDFDKLLDLHAQPNKNLHVGAKALFEECLAPIVDGRWDEVPWQEDQLPS